MVICLSWYISYVLCNKLPSIWQLETLHIYCLTVSMGQENRYSLSRSFSLLQISHKAAIKVSSRTEVLSEARLGKFPSSQSYWQDSVPGRWRATDPQLLARDHPQLLARWASLMWHLASSRQAGKESSKKAEVIILCSLVKEVTSHQLFHNILVISQPQDPYTREGDFTRVQISWGFHQEIYILRAIIEVAY